MEGSGNELHIRYRLHENFSDFEITDEQFLESLSKCIQDTVSKNPEKCQDFVIKITPRMNEMCAICWAEPATYMIVPCGHRILCEECVKEREEMVKNDCYFINICPICRGHVKSTVKYDKN